jgi:acyl-CoA synthetase (AMP-forming)/AMP-acid ligase II
VESAGAALRQRLPDPGSRIALCAANHCDHLVAYLAILVSGFVWIPLNPANGRSLNSLIASKSKPDLILVDHASLEQAPESEQLQLVDNLSDEPDAFEAMHAEPADVAAIKFTGGTTGEPKGVVQTHGNMLAVIENMQTFYDFSPRDCNLLVAPLTHGSSHYVFPLLAKGGRHRFPRDRSATSILAALRDNTTVTFVEAQRAFGPRISSLYGQTEAPLTISALGAEEMQESDLRGTVGRACSNSHLRVVNDIGVEVPAGTIGGVEAKGPIVMQGYLDEPALTGVTMRDGWLRTGDLGFLNEAGYLTLSGRVGEVIITGGFKVYPAEVENVMAKVPGVRECCVYSVDDGYWGERIEAVVVLDADSSTSESEIMAFIRNELGPVRTPKALHKVAALPRNAVGKVVRRDVPAYVETRRERSDVQSV